MDGYEVARQLRLHVSDRVILIALTAYGYEEDKRRCLHAGFDAISANRQTPWKWNTACENWFAAWLHGPAQMFTHLATSPFPEQRFKVAGSTGLTRC